MPSRNFTLGKVSIYGHVPCSSIGMCGEYLTGLPMELRGIFAREPVEKGLPDFKFAKGSRHFLR